MYAVQGILGTASITNTVRLTKIILTLCFSTGSLKTTVGLTKFSYYNMAQIRYQSSENPLLFLQIQGSKKGCKIMLQHTCLFFFGFMLSGRLSGGILGIWNTVTIP